VSYLHCRERPDIEAYACLYVIWQTIQYFSLKSSMTGSLRALLVLMALKGKVGSCQRK
jgi:hypothetical protein